MKTLHTLVVSGLLASSLAIDSATFAAADEAPTTFSYTDATATSVGVAGEFSNWSIISMSNDGAGHWSKTLSLKPGFYGYKFVVNNSAEWILDPKNPARKTVHAIENSGISVGGVQPTAPASSAATGDATVPAGNRKISVTFGYTDSKAKTVHVAGEFNNWLDNDQGHVTGHGDWAMQNDGAGNWKLTTSLPPGRYKFKYAVDGGEHWEQDPSKPASPDGNSIIEAKASDTQAAPVLAGSAPAQGAAGGTFTYVDPTAKVVFVAGEFNNWSTSANPLQKDASGIWTASVPLKPGRYQYKFVVDGDWRLDPANANSVDDGTGNMNSVKTVAQ
jgi:1,4-alpha-glucan branching enzyme